jgi:hypothetical protein
MVYVFIDKTVFCNNKRQINKFLNQEEFIAKLIFRKNSVKLGCVEIYVEFMDQSENFVECMFRKLGMDIIAFVGI